MDEVVIQVLVRWAVPCFLMMSGVLLLDKSKEMSLEKLKKYIYKTLLISVTFGFGFCMIENIFEGNKNIFKLFFLFSH